MGATRVYLDHNATTPMRPEVRELWLEVAAECGNPSSSHASGRRVRARIDEARERAAAALEVDEDELFFTSGATEANNLALLGSLGSHPQGRTLVVTTAEHSSVLSPARELAARGARLVEVGVDALGRVDPDEVGRAARGADLVSVSAANNETGVLAPPAEIAAGLGTPGPDRARFHVDAVQVLGRLPVRLAEWGADLASFSAHKLGGPPGVGLLWKRKRLSLEALQYGGGQELGLRPGTENAAGIAAAALAVELAVREREEFAARTAELANWLWTELAEALPALRLLGPALDSSQRLPNTLCLLVPGIDGKVLVTRLDLAGLEVSAGSACASGSVEPSHVLLAMGLGADEARSGLRLSLGRSTTHEECKRALAILRAEFSSSHAT